MDAIRLTYEERQAIAVVRKLLKRQPQAATLVLTGMAKEVAVNVLLQAKKELADLLEVSRAITHAAGELAKMEHKGD